MPRWPSTLPSACPSNTAGARSQGEMNASSPLTSNPSGVMLLTRRQPDKPAAAVNKPCSIRTPNVVYTEFGIDPKQD